MLLAQRLGALGARPCSAVRSAGDDRHGQSSTVITSQLPVELWHDGIGDATLANVMLDRLVHNAHMLALNSDSLRKKRSRLTVEAAQE